MYIDIHFNSFTAPDLILLVTNISVTVSGSSAVVCVETEGAASVKLILRDAREQRYIRECKICLSEILLPK